jgi:hypothetical protein
MNISPSEMRRGLKGRGPSFRTILVKKKENKVNNSFSKKIRGGGAAYRIIYGCLLAMVTVVATSGIAFAQDTNQDKKEEMTFSVSPTTNTSGTLAPQQGNTEFLVTHGVGTQGYVCLPSGSGVSFTVNNARPEATLFTNVFGEAFQVITHFLSPVENPNDVGPKPPRFGDATWESSFDSSKVWAQKTDFVHAGSDATCPNAGAIDCLLLQTIGATEGPTGGRTSTKTTFIQRLNTKGGSAPATGCSTAADVGKQVLVSYSADYHFFRAGQ